LDAHTKVDIQQAFVATSQDISKMWKTLENGGMVVTATVSCSDSIVRYFQDCESLTLYENSKRASIAALEIMGRSREPYVTAEISLGPRYSAPVSVSIRGEETLIASMRRDLTDTLDGMKPWYSRISNIDLFYVWFPVFTVLILLLQIMAPSDMPRPAVPLRKALNILAIVVTVIGLISAVIWRVAWLRKRFFPVATFAIGQGLARHQHYEQVRWVVIVGFLVSVVGSIVAAVLLAI